jgi:hypothetical protein
VEHSRALQFPLDDDFEENTMSPKQQREGKEKQLEYVVYDIWRADRMTVVMDVQRQWEESSI